MTDQTEETRRPPSVTSVALIGAPKTGKSEVATMFAEKAGKELGDFEVLDDYPEIVQDLGLAVGIYGDYRVTNLIHYLRWAAELNAIRAEKNYITVGTAYESLAHGALLLEVLQQGVQTPDTQGRMMPEVHAMTALSLWIVNTFSYRYGFYIPRARGLEVVGAAGAEQQERTYADRIDMAIQVAFEKFRQSLQRLEGSPEDMADTMVETVVKIETQIKADEHPTLNPDGSFRQEFLDAQTAAYEQAMSEADVEAAAQETQRQLSPEA